MPCRAVWTIAHRDRLTFKRVPIRIVYRAGEEIGAAITGIVKPTLNLTLPPDPATVDPRSLAEALCCATRGSILEAVFNIATALALIIGSATGIPEAIAVGLAGMTVTLAQALAKLARSRRGCGVTSQALTVAARILHLATSSLESTTGCTGKCTVLIAYGGQVYRVSKTSQEGRVELALDPL